MSYTGPPMAGFTGLPVIGDRPLSVQFSDQSTGIVDSSTGVGWLWTFGDGETGADQNPIHVYRGVDRYDVSLRVSTAYGDSTAYETGMITVYETVQKIEGSYIQIPADYTKTCNSFTCIGWIAGPQFEEGDSLVPLAVADTDNVVSDSVAAMRFEITKEADDYRLEYLGSKSKLIRLVSGVDIGDGSWHMIGYLCDDDGVMSYFIDGQIVPAETGIGDDGFPYSVAHTSATRLGGGDVWSPYLYKAGQGVSLYNWRYKGGLTLPTAWLQELMTVDRVYIEA